MQFRTCQS
jgi:NEDD8-activating enzyme E1